MAGSAARNKLIVDTYKNNQETYGKTIVFAVNVVHAIALAKLFQKSGVKAEFIVSDVKDMVTGPMETMVGSSGEGFAAGIS